MREEKKCLIVGCNGQFGQIFCQKLANEGITIFGSDIQDDYYRKELILKYAPSSIIKPTDYLVSLINEVDCIILCIPEIAIIDSIPFIMETAHDSSLIIDIASVKSRIAETVLKCKNKTGYLSIHPMFGPLIDFTSRNICYIPIKESHLTNWFINILSNWGASLIEISATEHDICTSYVQVATHASIIVFIMSCLRGKVPYKVMRKMTTPVQKVLLSLAARIASGDPNLYWDIQHDNPFAIEARNHLLRQMKEFSEIISSGENEELGEIFNEIHNGISYDFNKLKELASDIIAISKN